MREFGSEHPAIVLPDGYFDSYERYGREVNYFRTGREALLYVAYNCKPEKRAIILCPAFSCWSMIAPFEFAGWTIEYYRLNDDLTIDEEYLLDLLNYSRPSAILTMNYFGSASTKKAISMAKPTNYQINVIEDFTHCTFSLGQIYDEQVDFYVTSIRKSIGVCDGAAVISKRFTDKSFIGNDAPDFGELRLEAQKLKGRYSFTKSSDDKETFLSELKRGEDMISTLDAVHPMSEISKRMLESINGEEIASARRENMKHLWSLLNGKVRMIDGIERCFNGAPFSLPILVNNRDEVQLELAKKGVYAPVLWPIDDKCKRVCDVSTMISEQILSLPIDQRYSYDDIEDIASIVLATV